jgi:hypothetical protein
MKTSRSFIFHSHITTTADISYRTPLTPPRVAISTKIPGKHHPVDIGSEVLELRGSFPKLRRKERRENAGQRAEANSRGFDEAIADYDAALKLNPKMAASLYGRGLAKQKNGDQAGGDADIAAAKAQGRNRR